MAHSQSADEPLHGVMLTPDQTRFIEAVRAGRNVFLTGDAGTGKSHVIKLLPTIMPVSMTATTGVASVLIGATTIHGWAGIGIGTRCASRLIGKLRSEMSTPNTAGWRVRTATCLVIDEISMFPWHMFNLLHEVMRGVREQYDKPFGGVQLIVCGDFFQLPPVNKRPLTCVFCESPPVKTTGALYECKKKKYDGCLDLKWEATVRFTFETDPMGTNLWDHCDFTFIELTQVW